MEIGVDLRRDRGRRRGGAEREGLTGIAEIDELARDHAPFAPPCVGIDQRRRVARRLREPGGRLAGAIGAPRVLHPREQQAGVGLQRLRNCGDRARRQRAVGRVEPRLGERDLVGAGERRRAQGRRALSGVEQPVGAVFVVGAGQQRGEGFQRLALAPQVEVFLAPQRRDDRARLVAAARFERGARERELARRRRRRLAGEARQHDRRRRMVGVEMRLLDRADPVAAWPMRMRGGESGKALVVRPRREPERQPVESGALGAIFDLCGERVAADQIAPAIERRGGGERRAVETRRRGDLDRRSGRRRGLGLGRGDGRRRRRRRRLRNGADWREIDRLRRRERARRHDRRRERALPRGRSGDRTQVRRQRGDNASRGVRPVGIHPQPDDKQRGQPRRRRSQAESDHGESLARQHARALLSNR